MREWYCIFTKPGHEDEVVQRLSPFGDIELLNPKLRRSKVRRGRFAQVVENLFPSYIFSRFDLKRYFHMIRYTRGVRRFVGDTEGHPYVVTESIIESIRERMKEGFVVMKTPGLKAGDRVRVTDGPFAGFDGVFLSEVKPRERILILLNAIQFQARVELAPYQVLSA